MINLDFCANLDKFYLVMEISYFLCGFYVDHEEWNGIVHMHPKLWNSFYIFQVDTK